MGQSGSGAVSSFWLAVVAGGIRGVDRASPRTHSSAMDIDKSGRGGAGAGYNS